MNKFTSFAVTVRPRSGVSDKHVESFCKWVRKNCEFYYVITEKTGDERHIHSGLFLKIPKTRSNVCQMVSQLFKDFDSEEKANVNRSVKILYSNLFLTDYMDKDDDTVVIERNLPELKSLEQYYPPKPLPSVAATSKRLNMHSTMEQYERLWRDHVSPLVQCNTSTVRDFLFDMQYNQRVIGLMDDKKLIQHSRWFTRWYHRAETCPGSFLPAFETEEGLGIHDTRVHPSF